MQNLDVEELARLVTALEDEQVLWEERAYISFRLSQVCETQALEAEQGKNQVLLLLARLTDAEQLYGK